MKHLKNYQSFINEGAYLNNKGQAVLKWENDGDNSDEVLKSANAMISKRTGQFPEGVDFFKGTPIINTSAGSYGWPQFFGLSMDGYGGRVDNPARFKDTMAQLKDANIEDIETSIPQFIQKSFTHLGITRKFRPDYIVSVGSTKGLVGHLVKAANQIFPEADVVNLDKVTYLNAGDAVNWDELKSQVERQEKGDATLNSFKSTILKYAERLDPEFKRLIKDAKDVDDLRRLVMASGRYVSPETQIQWRDMIDGEKMTPFVVRTSGRNFGGFKAFFKKKYSFDDQEFIEAVITCARDGKRMLIIDDNKNSGVDIADIKKNILDILKGLGILNTQTQKLFGFWVLYKMEPRKDWEFKTKEGQTGTVSDMKKAGQKENLDAFRKSKGWTNPS